MEFIFLLCVLNDYLQQYRKYFYIFIFKPIIFNLLLVLTVSDRYFLFENIICKHWQFSHFAFKHLISFYYIRVLHCLKFQNVKWERWPPSDIIRDALKFHCYVTHWLLVWDRCSLSCEGNSLILVFFSFFFLKRIINFIRCLFGICSDETILTY